MSKYKWTFAKQGGDNRGDHSEDVSIKLFRDYTNRCLIREFAQNSIDAPSNAPNAEPVEIHLSYMQLDDDVKEQMVDSLYERMVACKRENDRTGNSKNAYINKVQFLELCKDRKVTCLKISDYNTTGMDYYDESLWDTEEEYYSHPQPPFNSCVLCDGASNKQSTHAGGSHGRGKNVGLEKSRIDAVYYSTMTEPFDQQGNECESKTFGEGIIKLSNHRLFSGPDKGCYMKDGFWGAQDGNIPDEGEDIPKCFRRTKPGTDVYIIGVDRSEDDITEIKQYMLRSFFAAIKLKKIKFVLFGEEFNSENLEDKMDIYFPESKYSNFDKVYSYYRIKYNPRPYCFKALCAPRDEEHFMTIEADASKYPHLGDAKLFIWKDESIKLNTKHKDTVLCSRDNGMIIEVRRLDSSKGFCGLLICDGEGGKYLRLMENVTHDEWSEGQLADASDADKALAMRTYAEVDQFLKDAYNSLFPRIEGDEQSVPGLDKIMGSLGNDRRSETGISTDGSEQNEDYNLLNFTVVTDGLNEKSHSGEKAGTLVARKRGGINKRIKNKLTAQKLPKLKTEKEKKDDDDENQDQGTENKKKKTNNNNKEPDNSGTVLQVGDVDSAQKGMHSEVIPALFLQKSIHSNQGIVHRIRINVFDDYDYCCMVINVADMGNGTPLRIDSIKRADFGRNSDVVYNDEFIIEGLYGNSVRGFRLDKGYNYFDVKFEDEIDHSLMITAYENK